MEIVRSFEENWIKINHIVNSGLYHKIHSAIHTISDIKCTHSSAQSTFQGGHCIGESNSLHEVSFTSLWIIWQMHMLTVWNQIVVKLSLAFMTSNIMWHFRCGFEQIAITTAKDEATFGILSMLLCIKTINNLVISHVFAHSNLLFIRLFAAWRRTRDDSDYDVEDDCTPANDILSPLGA